MDDGRSRFMILICRLIMNNTSNGTNHHISHLFISFWGLWSTIQDNSEKAVLYALIGMFLGLLGVLLLFNVVLCRKLEDATRKNKSRNRISDSDGVARKKQNEKNNSSPEEVLYEMQRAPSGGWTFHEGCPKHPRTPQSFASTPLLPAWDVFVHVDSPHESPALVSVSKQHLDPEDPCGQLFNAAQKQTFVSKSLPHRLFPAHKRYETNHHKPPSIANNNNDEDNDVWVRRSCLKLESNHFPASTSLPPPDLPILGSPLTEV